MCDRERGRGREREREREQASVCLCVCARELYVNTCEALSAAAERGGMDRGARVRVCEREQERGSPSLPDSCWNVSIHICFQQYLCARA